MASRRDMRGGGSSGPRRSARAGGGAPSGVSRREMRQSNSGSGMSRREMRESGSSSYTPSMPSNTGPRYRGGDSDSRYQGGNDNNYGSSRRENRRQYHNTHSKKSGCGTIISIIALILLIGGVIMHFNQGNTSGDSWKPAAIHMEVLNYEA